MTLKTKMKFCHDFMVVIDTNCFENYEKDNQLIPYCASNECHTFFTDRKLRLGLPTGSYYISESVFNEIVEQRKEKFDENKKQLNIITKSLNIPTPNVNEINFSEELNKYLNHFGIKILQYPPNDFLPKIIKRANSKKAPFKLIDKGKNGSDKGFKDVLLWESMINYEYEELRIGKVFLITANLKDFPIKDLLPEWKEQHPCVELSILDNWKDFISEEKLIFPELVAQNNIDYNQVLEMFKDNDSRIVELPNYKKTITARENSYIVEIETDVKNKNGEIYSSKYYYDVKINEPMLSDPENDIE